MALVARADLKFRPRATCGMARARYRAARCQALGAKDVYRRAGAVKRHIGGEFQLALFEADHDRKRRLGIFRFFIIDGAARGLSFVKCRDGAALLCRLPMRRSLASVVKKSRQNCKSGAVMKYLVSFPLRFGFKISNPNWNFAFFFTAEFNFRSKSAF